MAAVNVSKAIRTFLRGSSVSFRTIGSSGSKISQPQRSVNGAKQTAPLPQLVNPAFRQPMALLSTESVPKKKAKTYVREKKNEGVGREKERVRVE